MFGFFFLSSKITGERLLQTGQIPEKAGLGGISPVVLEQRAHPDRGTNSAHGCTAVAVLQGCQVIPDTAGAAGLTGTGSSRPPHTHGALGAARAGPHAAAPARLSEEAGLCTCASV